MYLWEQKKIRLDLKMNWKIHGGEVSTKTNDFLILKKGSAVAWGEVSPSTKNGDQALIASDLSLLDFKNIQSLEKIDQLPICPQVKCGLEMAWINLQCQLTNQTLTQYFKLKPIKKIDTCFSIPILPIEEIKNYIHKFNINNYKSCKLKIDGHQSIQFIKEVHKFYQGPLRIDANESYENADDVMKLITQLSKIKIDFIEQPLHRSNIKESILLKTLSSIPIIGDESIQNQKIDKIHVEMFDGLNIKLMKSGGYRQALQQIQQCRSLGLKVLLGCMVETSLSISGAAQIGSQADWFDLDGFLFLKDDPFKLIDEKNGELYINFTKLNP